jgi:hypothetical protein
MLADLSARIAEPIMSDCPPWMAHVAPRWRSGETRRAWLRAFAYRDPTRCDRCGRSGLPPTPSGLPPRWQARERKVLCWACK